MVRRPIFQAKRHYAHKTMRDVCFLVLSVLEADSLSCRLKVIWYNTKYDNYIPGEDTINVKPKHYGDYIEYDIQKANG